MELIKEIGEMDKNILYKIRKAARAILFNTEGKIALLNVAKYNYHKLPGGGVEEGEDISTSLEREIEEEVGASAEITGELGITIEYRNTFNQLQISYTYTAKVIGEIGKTNYTQRELEQGFSLRWMTLKEAIEVITDANKEGYFGDSEDEYFANFFVKRDLEILKFYASLQTA